MCPDRGTAAGRPGSRGLQHPVSEAERSLWSKLGTSRPRASPAPTTEASLSRPSSSPNLGARGALRRHFLSQPCCSFAAQWRGKPPADHPLLQAPGPPGCSGRRRGKAQALPRTLFRALNLASVALGSSLACVLTWEADPSSLCVPSDSVWGSPSVRLPPPGRQAFRPHSLQRWVRQRISTTDPERGQGPLAGDPTYAVFC